MSTKIKYKGETVTSLEGGQTATLHLTGKKLTDDLVIEASGGSNLPTYNGEYVSLGIKLISFTIGGTEYKAVEGMKWSEWVADTKYNTGSFIIFDSVYIGTDTQVIEVYTEDYARVEEDIIEGHAYKLTGRRGMAPEAPDDSPPK